MVPRAVVPRAVVGFASAPYVRQHLVGRRLVVAVKDLVLIAPPIARIDRFPRARAHAVWSVAAGSVSTRACTVRPPG